MRIIRLIGPLLMFLLLFTSCDNFQKVKKSNDMDWKYEKALEYYNNEKYYKAIPLFEELISVYKGTKQVQDIYYYYAYSQYEQENYLVAAYHYDNLYTNFPNGEFAQDCAYMNGFCYYKMSPRVSLEQTYTKKAIKAFKRYKRKYPRSDRIDKVDRLLEEMNVKLEQKLFNAGMLYYKMERFIASAQTFENFLEDYPSSKKADRAKFLEFKSNYRLAKNSVKKRKRQRYQNAIDSYYTFVDEYPNSSYINEAEELFQKSRNQLDKLKVQNE